MTAQKIKTDFHKLIDTLEDENILNNFYEAILEYSKKGRTDIIDELSEKQRQRLMDSIQQADEGNTMSTDKVKDEIKKWLTKIRLTENVFKDL